MKLILQAFEFNQIYGLETIIIPPHRTTQRKDMMDKVPNPILLGKISILFNKTSLVNSVFAKMNLFVSAFVEIFKFSVFVILNGILPKLIL